MNAGKQFLDPSPKRRVALGHMGQRRTCPMDQQFAQIYVPALADAEKPWLAAGCRLTRNQAKPRRKIATVLECLRLADRPEAIVAPTPGIATNRRASWFSY